MSRLIITTATAVLALGAIWSTPVSVRGEEKTPPAASESKTVVTDGTVQSYDARGGSFIISVKSGDATTQSTIKVNDKTSYMDDGKYVKADELLKSGKEVTVTHQNMMASKVEAKAKPAKTYKD